MEGTHADVAPAVRPGLARYAGSTRNGVTSLAYATWPGSFVVR